MSMQYLSVPQPHLRQSLSWRPRIRTSTSGRHHTSVFRCSLNKVWLRSTFVRTELPEANQMLAFKNLLRIFFMNSNQRSCFRWFLSRLSSSASTPTESTKGKNQSDQKHRFSKDDLWTQQLSVSLDLSKASQWSLKLAASHGLRDQSCAGIKGLGKTDSAVFKEGFQWFISHRKV